MNNGPTWTPQQGAQKNVLWSHMATKTPPKMEPNLGLQKSALWRNMAAKTPPKMEPNLGFKMTIYRVQVGIHLGTLVGGQDGKLEKS